MLQKLIVNFEMETGVEVKGGTISGLDWQPGPGLSLNRYEIRIHFEIEAV